jgi:hypothetical protein
VVVTQPIRHRRRLRTAYGERQYVTLGSRADGWTRQEAETEPHSYISLRVALGHDPATIARDAGHADMAGTVPHLHARHAAQRGRPGPAEGARQRRSFGSNWQ